MCFQSRKIPATIVALLSGLVLIAGIIMVGLTFRFNNADFFKEVPETEELKTRSFVMLIVLAILVVLLGIWGLTFICVRNRCGAFVFGIILAIVMIIVFVHGVVLGAVSNASPEQIQQFCAGDQAVMGEDELGTLQKQVLEFDDRLNRVIDLTMCSDACPCRWDPADGANPWQALSSDVLESRGRIYSSTFEQNSKNLYRMRFNAPEDEAVSNFDECWALLQKQDSTKKAANNSTVTDFIASGGDKAQNMALSLAQYIQANFDCSGICSTSLFYWGKDISAGTPINGDTCINYLKEEISNNLTYMGITQVIVAIVMLLLFFAQYCLWKKYED